MARRAANRAAGVTIPGVRDALAQHCRSFAEHWDAQRFADLAGLLERGGEVTVTSDTLAHALHRACPARYDLADQARTWRLHANTDTLQPVEE